MNIYEEIGISDSDLTMFFGKLRTKFMINLFLNQIEQHDEDDKHMMKMCQKLRSEIHMTYALM